MNEKYVRLIPSKKLKRKILNKAKFSKKLGQIFLTPMKEYQWEEQGERKEIQPFLYTNKKIAICLNDCDKDNKKINTIIKNILFPFDLYLNEEIKIKKTCFINRTFQEDLLRNPLKIKEYDYVIHIQNIDDIELFSYGWIESILTIFAERRGEFISIGSMEEQYDSAILYQNASFTNLVSSNHIDMLDIYQNRKLKIGKNIIFDTSILKDSDIFFLKEIPNWDEKTVQLLIRFLYLLSQRRIRYDKIFFLEEYEKTNNIECFSIREKDLYQKVMNYDTITFDIFDTLVTRMVFHPDDIFMLMEKKMNRKYKKSFIKMRKEAEASARTRWKKDVNIHEIYDELAKKNHLSKEEANKLKKLEIDTELEHFIPRKEMVDFFHKLKKEKKNLDIISDMYLTKDIITKILEKCGITGYRDLLMSCEENKRKDTGDLWKYYFDNHKEKTIHIGDNYQSDALKVFSFGRDAVKVLSSREFLQEYYMPKEEIENSSTYGILYNRYIFNSPFFSKEKIENNLKLYGQYFLSPIFITFFDWLQKVNTSNEILFISREGYYLQKIYKKWCALHNKKEIENLYFLASRRAVSLASCRNKEDLIELLDLGYEGSISGLFKNRYNFLLPKKNEKEIFLPRDKNEVLPLIDKYAKKILEKANQEEKNYAIYIAKMIPNRKEKTLSILDLGYAGTTQYYLSKMLEQKIEGYYFALTNQLRPKKIGCKITGCFNVDNQGKIDEENLIYKKSLFLESFLSSPDGQLLHFQEDGTPKFSDGRYNRYKIQFLDEIYLGILDGMEEFEKVSRVDWNTDIICEHYHFICNFLEHCEGPLAKVLLIDDNFCHDGEELIDLQKIN